MDKREPRPPLFIWFCLALAIAGLLGWIYYQHKRYDTAKAKALDENLQTGTAMAGTKPVVLVIGTSLIQSGLDSSSRISRCVEEATGTRIVLLKCWQSGGDLVRLSSIHSAALRRLRPSVVLVEANMLFYRPARTPFLSLYMQTFRDLITGHNDPHYDPDERVQVLPADRSAIESARAGRVDTSDLTEFRAICETWKKNGARIGLVNIPLEQKLEEKKWHSADTAGFNANLRYLDQKVDFSVNDARFRLDSTYFFDFGHLNRKGNDFFAPWFCRLLAEEVSSLSPGTKTAAP